MAFASRLAVAVAVALTHLAAGSAVFKWPNPLVDYTDEILWAGSVFLPQLTRDCNRRDNTTIAAQWIRIAYHDMATHNIDDGTGGLDASILYELDRPQNVGLGMRASLADFASSTTAYFGVADTIAIGTLFAISTCGGPVIPFKSGRIDATQPGPATVPEPHQDLPSHIESFRKQGFTQSEMIALVACGHAFGGVRHVDFPQIVDEHTSFGEFASSQVGFRNLVVTEYLNNSTQNPLVTGSNITTNSDLRIFSSDKNITMQRLASSTDTFYKACGDLIGRMINTVPKNVKLTEAVDPLDMKVTNVQLYPSNGSLVLNAKIRFLKANPNRTVKLFWSFLTTGTGACPSTGCSTPSKSTSTQRASIIAAKIGLGTFTVYSFSASIDINTSISKFWFTVDEGDGKAVVVDNGGDGFKVDDKVLFDAGKTSTGSNDVGDTIWKVVVAVKGSSTKAPSIKTYTPGSSLTSFIPTTTIYNDLVPDPDHPARDGYTFFMRNVTYGIDSVAVLKEGNGGEVYVRTGDFGVGS